jgi:NADH-quinone oxidoreductase subunit C
MENTCRSLKEKLLTEYDDIQSDIINEQRLMVRCEKDAVAKILEYLKSNGYDHLALISCVDWIKENKLELVYIVTPYMEKGEEGKMNIFIKTMIDRDKPEIDTVINIFENAEPYERELHELFGVYFNGHPRLIPLFLERKYEIPPFRKDFDTRKYVKDVFDEVPFVDDKKEKK